MSICAILSRSFSSFHTMTGAHGPISGLKNIKLDLACTAQTCNLQSCAAAAAAFE